MFTLTEHRLEAAKRVLDKYRATLQEQHRFDAAALEQELRQCWSTGYREIKDNMIQLLATDEYPLVAAWYMEHSNAPGVVVEFQAPLAKLYGVASYHSPEREEKQRQFWQHALGSSS